MLMRIVLGLLALLLGGSCFAASVSQRSPFYQGLWWDPNRSGHGFEIWNTDEHAAVIWYTYDDAGRPTWYIAAGKRETVGKQSWPLLQYRWSNGAASSVVAGSLRLNVRNSESLEVLWDIAGKAGTWTVQPFMASGVINEVDHSGVWFDPGNSGWGLSLTEQGDVLGGVLYTYDTTGAPMWALGFERGGTGSPEFHTYNGYCPACPYRTPLATSVGRLSFEMKGEAETIVRNRLTLPMAAGVNVDGARIVQLGRPASSRGADRQLASFDDDASAGAYLAAGMMNIPPISSGGQFSAPPPAIAFSQTNLQESGVDEADMVKSNGLYVYTYAHDNNGVRQAAVRTARIDNEGAVLSVRGTVPLTSGPKTSLDNAGLFLHADQLVSITATQATSYVGPPWAQPGAWIRGTTTVEVFSVSVPELPTTRWRAEIDGHLVTSRRIGDRLYVISRFAPYLPGFAYGTSYPPEVAANQQLLATTPLLDLLPKVRIGGGAAAPLLPPTAVHVPPQGSRKAMADMIVVTAIDLTQPRIAQALAIIGSIETAYASTTNLFVASLRHEQRDTRGFLLPVEPYFSLTDIHQIRLAADAMSIVGSGSIEGVLGSEIDKAAFRLSEYQGRLRAVTSSGMLWDSANRNRLTILEPSTIAPGLLKTVSYLPNPRRPQTLGKPNELLYGTRFVGDRLYAVTFKKIDPLYVVDLADSADPRISGALELPGFADYLHPLPNGLLLGFGKDARPAQSFGDGQFAWFQGLQLTLFDVQDASQPRELQRVVIGKRGSESALLKHHHAFSALTQADGSLSIAIPTRVHDGPTAPYMSDWDIYPWRYSGLARFEVRGTTAADARLVQLASLVTHTSTQGSPLYNDAAADDARSVLLRNGVVYVANGRFWHRDSSGVTTGPQ